MKHCRKGILYTTLSKHTAITCYALSLLKLIYSKFYTYYRYNAHHQSPCQSTVIQMSKELSLLNSSGRAHWNNVS